MAKKIFSLAAACLLGFMLLPTANHEAQPISPSDTQQENTQAEAAPNEQALFPELSAEDILSIHIRARNDCEFDFVVRGELSVNGQKADGEVFSTLVDQLTAQSYFPCDSFAPQNESILTVTISTDMQDFFASFYENGKNGKYAYVATGDQQDCWLKTDAWRVGTLLLTCEGTRIFDASGQETPVD